MAKPKSKAEVLSDLQAGLDEANNKADELIARWTTEVNKAIARMPDKQPVNPKNETMRQFLIRKRKELINKPQDVIAEYKNYINKRVDITNNKDTKVFDGN